MLPYLSLGPFLLQTSGVALLIGVWIGLSLTEREAVRLQIKPNVVYNMIFLGLVGGIIGARLAYAARYISAYLNNPISLFALNPNTLSPVEGLLIGLLVASIYGWRKGLSLRTTLDALAPGLAVIMVAIGVSHLLSGDAFGSPSLAPWRIYLWNEYRHPAQIYEILAALGVLFIVLKRPIDMPGAGINFLLMVALTAFSRIFLEAFRGDSVIWFGGFRAAQIVALLFLAGSMWLMQTWVSLEKRSADRHQGEQPSRSTS
jgi:phosphatidylglycerol:prolipoprotein diacylglycerol transferase